MNIEEEQKRFAKMWIDELIYPEAIKEKIKEAEEGKKYYLKMYKLHNWNNAVVKENIKSFDVFINELKKVL